MAFNISSGDGIQPRIGDPYLNLSVGAPVRDRLSYILVSLKRPLDSNP